MNLPNRSCSTLQLRRRLALVSSVLALVGSSDVAFAQAKAPAPAAASAKADLKSKAIAAFKAGKAAFDAGNYTLAIEQLTEADKLIPGAAPKFMLGQSHDKLGHVAEAVSAYRAFIGLAPEPSSTWGKRMPEAKARVAELEKQLPAEITVTVVPTDVVPVFVVDGASGQTSPLSLAPGQHTLVVTSSGFTPHTETIVASPAERREITVALKREVEAVAPLPIEPEAPRSSGLNLPAVACLSASAVTAIAGGVFGGLALKESSNFQADPTAASADATERNAQLADVFFGVALATGAAGGVLWFVGGDEEKRGARAPEIRPWVGAHGAGTSMRWSF